MPSLEYVASGTSHTRILAVPVQENPVLSDIVNEHFVDMNGRNNHSFSLLFNAFTERNFGERIQNMYAKNLHAVHADSGGLQIITQGKKITPELKRDIYRTQATYSDIGMCFDEIPLNILNETSDRNDTTGRIFDRDNLEAYARKTGQNIKEQIEVFLEEKSKSKPMIIAQGNCYDTYMLWVEYILKEIPSHYYKHIGGIAMGAAALGTGPLEDIERAIYATKLPFQMENPYIHILGVGSIRRMLPYLALINSKYYPENIHLSYDSTTHTSGVSIGLFYKETGLKLSRTFNDKYYEIFEDVDAKYGLRKHNINVEKFFKMINSSSDFYRTDKYVDMDKAIPYYRSLIGFVCSSIQNFTYRIDECSRSKKALIKTADESGVFSEINSLLNVQTLDDFNEWKRQHGTSVKSSRISDTKPATLSAFFGD